MNLENKYAGMMRGIDGSPWAFCSGIEQDEHGNVFVLYLSRNFNDGDPQDWQSVYSVNVDMEMGNDAATRANICLLTAIGFDFLVEAVGYEGFKWLLHGVEQDTLRSMADHIRLDADTFLSEV